VPFAFHLHDKYIAGAAQGVPPVRTLLAAAQSGLLCMPLASSSAGLAVTSVRTQRWLTRARTSDALPCPPVPTLCLVPSAMGLPQTRMAVWWRPGESAQIPPSRSGAAGSAAAGVCASGAPGVINSATLFQRPTTLDTAQGSLCFSLSSTRTPEAAARCMPAKLYMDCSAVAHISGADA